ncbi:MAG: MlaD family protein [Gammaproteobacteria bacterium]|nr:MlaD family protein [Gammaproteobacteria bacterium]MDE0247657.1 MlaD family protein [Gammaproteobacteria bacterium]
MSPLGRSRRRPGPTDQELERITPPLAGGSEIRAGVFVLIGVLAFGAVLFIMTDPAAFRGRYMVLTEVANAEGIRRGDPVQMRGVNIGRVHQFDLSSEGVVVTLEIEGRWEIPEDSRTTLGSLDLLGGRTVQIVIGTSPNPVQPGQVLPGEAMVGVMALADTMGAEVRHTLSQLQTLLADSTVAAVHASVSDLEALIGNLAAITEEEREGLSALSASLSRSAARVEELTGREELDRGIARADSTLSVLQQAGASLSRATSSLEAILARMEGGEGTLGRLSEDEALYETLDRALAEIGDLARDIRENPDRYINIRIF